MSSISFCKQQMYALQMHESYAMSAKGKTMPSVLFDCVLVQATRFRCCAHVLLAHCSLLGLSVTRACGCTELHNATMQATFVRQFQKTPLGEVANKHGYLSTGLCALQLTKKVILRMA
jgi:hypothetical protein